MADASWRGQTQPLMHPRDPSSVDVTLKCPVSTCDSIHPEIAIRTTTVMTFRCPKCGFMWAVDIGTLPEAVSFAVSPKR